jgi:hypothetical protein
MLGKAESPLLATSNRCIAVKNKKGCNAVAFCAYKKMQVFSAVSYAVRVEDKFELTLYINGIKKSCGDRGSHV